MMRYVFTFNWMAKLSEKDIEELNKLVTPTPIKLDEEGRPVSYQQYLGDIEKVAEITKGISLVSKPEPNIFLDILAALEKLDRPFSREQEFNEKVSVHVPGIGLLNIHEAMVLVDCCTDTLNASLSEGWRILAVCPQPDQRRPDYVMGRSL